MRHISRLHSWSLCTLIGLFLLASPSQAKNSFTYCSSENTGASFSAVYDIYQSYGACFGTCQSDGYSVAILLEFQCWCSNEVPANTTTLSLCSVNTCPGYPSDPCGNIAQGLYGYILIGTPTGTVGLSVQSSSSSTSTTVPSSSRSTTTSTTSADSSTETTSTLSTSTSPSLTTSSTLSSQSSSSSDSTSSSLSSSSTTSSSSSSVPPTSTETVTPSPFVSVVTVVGATKTLVITPTPSLETSSSSSTDSLPTSTVGTTSNSSSSSFWQNKGAVAGTFVAVGIVVLLLILIPLFIIRRRRRRRQDEMSAAGKAPQTPPLNDLPPAKFGFSASSRRRSTATIGGGATTALDSEKQADYAGAYSAPPAPPRDRFQVDQRIDPGTMYMQYHDNYSRGSLRDEYDYSRRVLKVLNPDDE
ncbi:hypothetical protein V1509DRAFT_624921 [Lipomyces kononenkoae]